MFLVFYESESLNHILCLLFQYQQRNLKLNHKVATYFKTLKNNDLIIVIIQIVSDLNLYFPRNLESNILL